MAYITCPGDHPKPRPVGLSRAVRIMERLGVHAEYARSRQVWIVDSRCATQFFRTEGKTLPDAVSNYLIRWWEETGEDPLRVAM